MMVTIDNRAGRSDMLSCFAYVVLPDSESLSQTQHFESFAKFVDVATLPSSPALHHMKILPDRPYPKPSPIGSSRCT
ncbi:hypothetical protein SAY87_002596 [Trapa incisa]|uniref:Uncharacterized protein n=1 Tax=Trapa incisa TaxID=236973 RepID=A0AAN7JW78_9MYRT|nr:hypothetical protein SAY87_002596 [Trapa incisa]